MKMSTPPIRSWTAPYIKRQVPMVMNGINEPQEKIDLMDAELTYAGGMGLVAAPLVEVAASCLWRYSRPILT